MKAKGVILSFCAMLVFFASYACANEPEPQQASSAKPVMVPYLNKSISEVNYEYEFVTDGNQPEADGDRDGSGEDSESDVVAAVLKNTGRMEGGEGMQESVPELVGEVSEPDEPIGGAEDPVLTYLGPFTITFYCPCEQCCGEWATGCTASGVLATEWHTIATSEQFPFGTRLYIDGLGYFTVEDRGVGDNCIDVFVNDHDEALNYGLQYRDVYLVEG